MLGGDIRAPLLNLILILGPLSYVYGNVYAPLSWLIGLPGTAWWVLDFASPFARFRGGHTLRLFAVAVAVLVPVRPQTMAPRQSNPVRGKTPANAAGLACCCWSLTFSAL